MLGSIGTRETFGPYLPVVPATTVIGALSSSLGGSVAAIIGAAAGFAWGVLIGFAAIRLNRLMPRLAGCWLFIAAFIATTLFGGTLFAMLLYGAERTPEGMLGLMRAPLKGGFTFFVIFNSLMEWFVIPVALFLNWQHPLRRPLLIACAVLSYLSRAWSYLYFVPQILRFMVMRTGASISDDMARSVSNWVNLSWLRCLIDGVTAILFLRAAARCDQIVIESNV